MGDIGLETSDFRSIRVRLPEILSAYQWTFIGYLIVADLVPTLYALSNTYWIGHISNAALAITEQYEFPSVMIEIVNQTIPFGVLALVAQNFRNKEKIMMILKSALVIQLFFSGILMSMMLLFMPQFVSTIGTPAAIVSHTRSYLILQSIALPFNSIATLLLVSIKSMRKGRAVLYLVISSVVLNMVMDLFLISNTPLSIHLGIDGSAIGYVISQAWLFVVAAGFAVKTFGLGWGSLSLSKWIGMVRPLFSIGGWMGLDSLVRNVGYILVPLNVLNVIGVNPYGGYELAMTVMWTVIIPMLAIVEGTQVTLGNYYGARDIVKLKRVLFTSLLLVSGVMTGVAVGGVFFWRGLSAFFNQNPVMVEYSTATFWWMIVPYVLYGLGEALQSVLVGTGQTRYVMYNSAVCNFGLIFPFWILARLGFLVASFENVMILFVVVFAIDFGIASFFVRTVLGRIAQEEPAQDLAQPTLHSPRPLTK
jgi:Na+-driven multidrug efflux pump